MHSSRIFSEREKIIPGKNLNAVHVAVIGKSGGMDLFQHFFRAIIRQYFSKDIDARPVVSSFGCARHRTSADSSLHGIQYAGHYYIVSTMADGVLVLKNPDSAIGSEI